MMCWNWWDTKNFIGVIWNAIPLCITWIIQKEYNNRTFEGLEHSFANVKLSLLCTFYTWMAMLSGHSVCVWHWLKKSAFFYYLAYFCNYSQVLLHFLVLFMSSTVLFQLPFSFIYSTFSKKFSISAKLTVFKQTHILQYAEFSRLLYFCLIIPLRYMSCLLFGVCFSFRFIKIFIYRKHNWYILKSANLLLFVGIGSMHMYEYDKCNTSSVIVSPQFYFLCF